MCEERQASAHTVVADASEIEGLQLAQLWHCSRVESLGKAGLLGLRVCRPKLASLGRPAAGEPLLITTSKSLRETRAGAVTASWGLLSPYRSLYASLD